MSKLRQDAELIWRAAVESCRPHDAMRMALRDADLSVELKHAQRIIVVGGGKAGAGMAAALEELLPNLLDRVEGIVNVPAGAVHPLRRIRLHAARPAGVNEPAEAGVLGAEEMLRLVEAAGPDDVVLCLVSGGGSALLPLPFKGIPLADKQQVTQMLHACGATINEMNAVRKHLSRIKGGRLAAAFQGKALFSLIISDVIGDPLDVIASGLTAPDPTTFADALAVLNRFDLSKRVPASVRACLEAGAGGATPETPKQLPANIHNRILANCAKALAAAGTEARELGYAVLNLGAFIEGETREIATAMTGIIRSIRADWQPLGPPACIISGGETTVRLAANHGLGGRNQEFVLAAALKLGADGLRNAVILSGGTDGEDGPTDAAGAFADVGTLERANQLGLDLAAYLARNDAYHFFESTTDLYKPGLTGTNVMDVRVILVCP